MEVEVLNDFNFATFLSASDAYKIGIRNKGRALINIEEITPQGEDEVEVILGVTRRLDKSEENFVLVFRETYEIYNIPVNIKSREKEKHYTLKKSGKVVCTKDRRDYERVDVEKKVEYYIANSQRNINHLYTGTIIDMSASGAQLVTARELDTSKPIALNTTFMELPLDELRGKIVWKEEGKNRKYYNGMQFQFSEPKNQEALINYLYHDEGDEKE